MSSTTKPRATTKRHTAIFALVIILIGTVTYIFAAYEYNYPPFCSGYPPGGDCPGTYTYTFTISVNYTGPWRLTYQGFLGMGESNPAGVSGNLTGSGPSSQPVTLFGPNNNGLTICATRGEARRLELHPNSDGNRPERNLSPVRDHVLL